MRHPERTFNYLIAGTGSKIKCVATPQRIGRTIAVYDVVLTDPIRSLKGGHRLLYVLPQG